MEKKFDHVDRMYTFLRGYCESRHLENSLKALPFARKAHEGVYRKGGEPYIVHPLSVAEYGINIGLNNDYDIATDLLHDVVEDVEDISVNDLPVCDEIKHAVDLLSFKKHPLLDKNVALQLYYEEITNNEIASFAKLLDCYHNLTTRAGVFNLEKTLK